MVDDRGQAVPAVVAGGDDRARLGRPDRGAVAGGDVDARVHAAPPHPEPRRDGPRRRPDEPALGRAPARRGRTSSTRRGAGGCGLAGPDQALDVRLLPAQGVDLAGVLLDPRVEGGLEPRLVVAGPHQLGQAVGGRLPPGLGLVAETGEVALLRLLVLAGGAELAQHLVVGAGHVGQEGLPAAGLGQVARADDLEQGVAAGMDIGPDGDGGRLPAQAGHALLGGGQAGLGRAHRGLGDRRRLLSRLGRGRLGGHVGVELAHRRLQLLVVGPQGVELGCGLGPLGLGGVAALVEGVGEARRGQGQHQ
jgi:hypothetical protein